MLYTFASVIGRAVVHSVMKYTCDIEYQYDVKKAFPFLAFVGFQDVRGDR